jgi:AbiJ N-terminal domain 3
LVPEPTELLNKRTRNLFREHLVDWPLAEITTVFGNVGVAPDLSYDPPVSGARRRLVEQIHHSVDFAQSRDVARIVAAYADIIRTGLARGDDRKKIEPLQSALRADGFVYDGGGLAAVSPTARSVLDHGHPRRSVSEITRRAIIDVLAMALGGWSGQMSELQFLSRLFDLRLLPSTDHRFPTMDGDVWQHRENNRDGPDDWVFFDERLSLYSGPDEGFLRFVSETVTRSCEAAPKKQPRWLTASTITLRTMGGRSRSRNECQAGQSSRQLGLRRPWSFQIPKSRMFCQTSTCANCRESAMHASPQAISTAP